MNRLRAGSIVVASLLGLGALVWWVTPAAQERVDHDSVSIEPIQPLGTGSPSEAESLAGSTSALPATERNSVDDAPAPPPLRRVRVLGTNGAGVPGVALLLKDAERRDHAIGFSLIAPTEIHTLEGSIGVYASRAGFRSATIPWSEFDPESQELPLRPIADEAQDWASVGGRVMAVEDERDKLRVVLASLDSAELERDADLQDWDWPVQHAWSRHFAQAIDTDGRYWLPVLHWPDTWYRVELWRSEDWRAEFLTDPDSVSAHPIAIGPAQRLEVGKHLPLPDLHFVPGVRLRFQCEPPDTRRSEFRAELYTPIDGLGEKPLWHPIHASFLDDRDEHELPIAGKFVGKEMILRLSTDTSHLHTRIEALTSGVHDLGWLSFARTGRVSGSLVTTSRDYAIQIVQLVQHREFGAELLPRETHTSMTQPLNGQRFSFEQVPAGEYSLCVRFEDSLLNRPRLSEIDRFILEAGQDYRREWSWSAPNRILRAQVVDMPRGWDGMLYFGLESSEFSVQSLYADDGQFELRVDGRRPVIVTTWSLDTNPDRPFVIATGRWQPTDESPSTWLLRPYASRIEIRAEDTTASTWLQIRATDEADNPARYLRLFEYPVALPTRGRSREIVGLPPGRYDFEVYDSQSDRLLRRWIQSVP